MRVAVVCGGPSREAEVSRSSGREVAAALRRPRDDVPGSGGRREQAGSGGRREQAGSGGRREQAGSGGRRERVAVFELSPRVGDELRDWGADVVFPVLHGPPGEDGTFQGFLEILELPYVGSGVGPSATAMDKTLAKHVFRAAGLPVVDDVTVDRAHDTGDSTKRTVERLGAEVVVKPAREGSAIGVRFATGADEILAALASGLEETDLLLVERRVTGREITVAILDQAGGPYAFPVVEVVTPEGSWYDYEHRYTPGLSEHLIPAPLPDDVNGQLQDIARRAHLALGCRDMSRADFVVSEEEGPVLLEVNTLPGMTATSLYPDAAAADGIPFPQLVARLVERAVARSG